MVQADGNRLETQGLDLQMSPELESASAAEGKASGSKISEKTAHSQIFG